jgi:hypothetical protein
MQILIAQSPSMIIKERVLTLLLSCDLIEPTMTGKVEINLNQGGITEIKVLPVRTIR